MSKINKIRLSGTTYDIEDSGATKTVEVTQAEYDALVSGGTVDPNTFYVITDATAADLSQYWTSAQTQSAITNAVSGKQDTLVSGTNIKTINNESILGSGNIDIQGGGGSTYSAGTNISIDSSNNINCTIPLSAGTGTGSVKGGIFADASSDSSFAFGCFVNAKGIRSAAFGNDNTASKQSSFVCGSFNISNGEMGSFATGKYNNSTSGQTDSGNTLFSVGNGTANKARHNAFEIKTNGDVYIPNTDDTTTQNYYEKPMVRLQDTITATAANTTALGGMKIVKLTESEYTALVTKDESTLYVVVPDPSN